VRIYSGAAFYSLIRHLIDNITPGPYNSLIMAARNPIFMRLIENS
jgi:hypothetical protein